MAVIDAENAAWCRSEPTDGASFIAIAPDRLQAREYPLTRGQRRASTRFGGHEDDRRRATPPIPVGGTGDGISVFIRSGDDENRGLGQTRRLPPRFPLSCRLIAAALPACSHALPLSSSARLCQWRSWWQRAWVSLCAVRPPASRSCSYAGRVLPASTRPPASASPLPHRGPAVPLRADATAFPSRPGAPLPGPEPHPPS